MSALFLSSSVLSFTLGAILPSSLPGQLGLANLSGVPVSLRSSPQQFPASPQRLKAFQEGFLKEGLPGNKVC